MLHRIHATTIILLCLMHVRLGVFQLYIYLNGYITILELLNAF